PGPEKKDTVGHPADHFLRQFLAREQLLGEDGVLGLDQADAAVQLDRNAAPARRPLEITRHMLTPLRPLPPCAAGEAGHQLDARHARAASFSSTPAALCGR